MNFRTAFYALLPSWLTSDDGERVVGSLAAVKDLFVERMRQGLLARYPSYTPPTGLPYLGRDRGIVRGIGEPEASYRVRLLRYLDDHKIRGNPFALLEQLRAYCGGDGIRVRTVDRRGNWFTIDRDGTRDFTLGTGNWDWDPLPASPQWARFWVIIYPTADGLPWGPAAGTFGPAGGAWGSAIGTPGYTIGTTATTAEVASVRTIIRQWQPDGTRCEWIIIAFDDASFDPTAPEPDGTWKNWGKDDGAGGYVPARLKTARYWKGVDGAPITQ